MAQIIFPSTTLEDLRKIAREAQDNLYNRFHDEYVQYNKPYFTYTRLSSIYLTICIAVGLALACAGFTLGILVSPWFFALIPLDFIIIPAGFGLSKWMDTKAKKELAKQCEVEDKVEDVIDYDLQFYGLATYADQIVAKKGWYSKTWEALWDDDGGNYCGHRLIKLLMQIEEFKDMHSEYDSIEIECVPDRKMIRIYGIIEGHRYGSGTEIELEPKEFKYFIKDKNAEIYDFGFIDDEFQELQEKVRSI